jgi:HSP20 family protein
MNLMKELIKMGNDFERFFNENIVYSEYTGYKKDLSFNVYENKDNVLITTEIPGINKEDIDLNITSNIITLKCKRDINFPKDVEIYKNERYAYDIERSFELPFRISSDKIEANYKDGVLSIKLEKLEEEKPKTIEVKVN